MTDLIPSLLIWVRGCVHQVVFQCGAPYGEARASTFLKIAIRLMVGIRLTSDYVAIATRTFWPTLDNRRLLHVKRSSCCVMVASARIFSARTRNLQTLQVTPPESFSSHSTFRHYIAPNSHFNNHSPEWFRPDSLGERP
jgi:hypothetical protein